MSRNAIKYLAMAAMFCNHFAYIFLKEGSTGQEVMVDIGYFTAITTTPLLFALGQKPFRHSSKTFSTKGENVFDQRQKVYDQAV